MADEARSLKLPLPRSGSTPRMERLRPSKLSRPKSTISAAAGMAAVRAPEASSAAMSRLFMGDPVGDLYVAVRPLVRPLVPAVTTASECSDSVRLRLAHEALEKEDEFLLD